MKTRSIVALTFSLTLLLASCVDKTPFQRAEILEGAPNFRDLGEYPSASGGRTVSRKMYRSEKLSRLTDGDLETIRTLGIRTVIDFRGDDEVSADPSRLPDGVWVVRLPLAVGNVSNQPIMEQLAAGTLDSVQCVGFMQTINRRFVTDFTQPYREFFTLLLDPASYPVVFHCTAGKDRTGFAAAMLLSALDVDWDTVMDDYMLTNRYLKPQSALPQMSPQAAAAIRQMWGVHPSYLGAARDEITLRHGTIDNYLAQVLNVGETEKAKLKRLLLK